MQRRAYPGGPVGLAALAALAGLLVGCTSGDGGGGRTGDGKQGASADSSPTAEPGRYQTLPEPCGELEPQVLREALFPEGPAEDAAGVSAALEGEAAITFDTDRRAGCSWQHATALGSRHLSLDFERVVSYDTAVSDGDRAVRLFEERAAKAGIPATAPEVSEEPSQDGTADGGPPPDASPDGASPDGSASPGAGDAESTGDAGDADAPEEPGTSSPSGPPAPDPALAPRPLEGIGEAAYLDDELVTADAGVHRDITLVFRTANVIVTVEYDQWSTDKRRLPDSEELQQQARKLAQRLAERFDG
ncbi:hypothetical protein V1J52_25640 [Streptomyces sp. TRM 70351]|uniref:hypothetical protein n=1 Tax=Streptomyces sp. TRM 70351 TaxID=3116552 RepID=UPI002E7B847F|nr:hypothetical protein [Streptomyces sp. TRM 70351]MEE1931506.1 hypothetical protein [Streptomyces sp. TRM 70351]